MTIVETNETKRGSGISGAPKYGVCQTYIYYKFANNALLTAFQKCQSTQTAYVGRRGGGGGGGAGEVLGRRSGWPPRRRPLAQRRRPRLLPCRSYINGVVNKGYKQGELKFTKGEGAGGVQPSLAPQMWVQRSRVVEMRLPLSC